MNKALEKGYIIRKINEILQFDQTTKYDTNKREGGLFAEYVNTFLKFKQQSSGYPDWIRTREDRDKYIEDYETNEGVILQASEISKNPGLLSLSKMFLNSLWGKLGQRLNMMQTSFIHSSETEKFFKLISDPTKIVKKFHVITHDTIHMEYIMSNDFIQESYCTNVYLSSFTTCWARLTLYDIIDELQDRACYVDTDSAIYITKPGQNNLPRGDYRGDLKSELHPDDSITAFLSAGAKHYSQDAFWPACLQGLRFYS